MEMQKISVQWFRCGNHTNLCVKLCGIHGMKGAREEWNTVLRMAGLTTDLPRPFRPRTTARAMYLMHHLLDRKNPLWYGVSVLLNQNPTLYGLFTAGERFTKNRMFGCRMCGQCALPATGYACPMTCPKQLRNGPCGGVGMDGSCEVYPDRRCVWLMAYERADQEGHIEDMRRLQRPIDQRKWGQSSWVNYWQGEDDALWTDENYRRNPDPVLLVGAGE